MDSFNDEVHGNYADEEVEGEGGEEYVAGVSGKVDDVEHGGEVGFRCQDDGGGGGDDEEDLGDEEFVGDK